MTIIKVDLLDMTFAVTQSHLGRKSDIIRRDLMCLNPQYSGAPRPYFCFYLDVVPNTTTNE